MMQHDTQYLVTDDLSRRVRRAFGAGNWGAGGQYAGTGNDAALVERVSKCAWNCGNYI